MPDDEPLIFLHQAISQTPGAKRPELVAALRAKEIPTESTSAPWMVKLSDIQAWVAAHP
jgi:hypothetical protein